MLMLFPDVQARRTSSSPRGKLNGSSKGPINMDLTPCPGSCQGAPSSQMSCSSNGRGTQPRWEEQMIISRQVPQRPASEHASSAAVPVFGRRHS